MTANPILGIAGSMATTYLNNRMAQENATISYNRQKELMAAQNAINMANAQSMPGVQSLGLKQAGFNPAMVNGAGTQTAPTVSQGNADMPQTIPFNSQDALMFAQIRNIDAQTDLLQSQKKTEDERPGQVNADKELKLAQKLFTNSSKDKVDEEVNQLRNINSTFQAENESIALLGQAMAEKWQKSDWYKALAPDTKATIDSIASGEYPLSVGAMNALLKVISAQKNLSDADRAMIDNAFANVITEAMWKDPKVKDAIAKLPVTQQAEAQSRTAKNLVETGILGIEKANKQDLRDVYLRQDPDKLYLEYQKDPSLENLVKWLSATFNDKLNKIVDKLGPAVVGGYGAARGMQAGRGNSFPSSSPNPLKVFEKDPDDPHGTKALFKRYNNQGVENMRK